MSFLQKNFKYIVLSIKDSCGKISSSRISSYYILSSILLLGAVFASIEVANAVYSIFWKGTVYTVPAEHIVIFGMMLSHHLVLLGLKTKTDRLLNKEAEAKEEEDLIN